MSSDITVLPRPARAPSPTPRDLLAVLFRQRRPALVSFFVVLTAVLMYGIFFPSYESHMKILVRRGRMDPSSTPTVPQTAPFDRSGVSEEELNSEVELLHDQEILRSVVDDLPDAPGEVAERERTMLKMSRRLNAHPIRKTALIEVMYSSHYPAEAANVLRYLARAYLQRHVRVQQPSGEFDFFEQQARRAEEELASVQKRLVSFTEQEGVVSASLERDNALQRLNDAESSYRQLAEQIAGTSEKLRSLEKQLPGLPERTVRQERSADNPELLGKLKARLLELQLKRTELLTRFEPTYRLVQEADQQIAETETAIAGEEARPVRDQTTDKNPDREWAQAEILKARIELSSLRSRALTARKGIDLGRATAEQLGRRAILQDTLLQELKTAEASYLLYANKREEARIGDALNQHGILNVSIAEQPTIPALPARSAMSFGALGLLAGGVFSTTVAFVNDRLDPSFRTPEEVVLHLATPVLATLPLKPDFS